MSRALLSSECGSQIGIGSEVRGKRMCLYIYRSLTLKGI